jgi:hypothetical protein
MAPIRDWPAHGRNGQAGLTTRFLAPRGSSVAASTRRSSRTAKEPARAVRAHDSVHTGVASGTVHVLRSAGAEIAFTSCSRSNHSAVALCRAGVPRLVRARDARGGSVSRKAIM